MALTDFQRTLCRLISASRIEAGESYVAGGAALNVVLDAPRLSRDIDLFHDSDEALAATWASDRNLITGSGYGITIVRERPAFVEANVEKGGESVLVQWVRDSAYRFFPLVTHDVLGLTLHPFDLATNKVLALVGRLEVRDWIDLIGCHERIQPLGFLAWGACGKDPGFNPRSLLEHARRSARYTAAEVEGLSFEGPRPDAGELSRLWREMLSEADRVIELLPPERVGTCVVGEDGTLFRGGSDELVDPARVAGLKFREGSLRGVFPTVRPSS